MSTRSIVVAAAVLFASAAFAEAQDRFVTAFASGDIGQESDLTGPGIHVVEVFEGENRSFAVLTAPDRQALSKHLDGLGLTPQRLLPVDFVNSPEVGGGEPAGDMPRTGHSVYVIERPIPGVGSFPLEKKRMISKRSNDSVRELGGKVEWDHSYLTNEGTFCVYRAEDEAAIRHHAKLAGAPIDLITLTHGKAE